MRSLFAHTSFSVELEIVTTLVAEYGPIPDEHPLSEYKVVSAKLREASRLRNKNCPFSIFAQEWDAAGLFAQARGKLDIQRAKVELPPSPAKWIR